MFEYVFRFLNINSKHVVHHSYSRKAVRKVIMVVNVSAATVTTVLASAFVWLMRPVNAKQLGLETPNVRVRFPIS